MAASYTFLTLLNREIIDSNILPRLDIESWCAMRAVCREWRAALAIDSVEAARFWFHTHIMPRVAHTRYGRVFRTQWLDGITINTDTVQRCDGDLFALLVPVWLAACHLYNDITCCYVNGDKRYAFGNPVAILKKSKHCCDRLLSPLSLVWRCAFGTHVPGVVEKTLPAGVCNDAGHCLYPLRHLHAAHVYRDKAFIEAHALPWIESRASLLLALPTIDEDIVDSGKQTRSPVAAISPSLPTQDEIALQYALDLSKAPQDSRALHDEEEEEEDMAFVYYDSSEEEAMVLQSDNSSSSGE